MAELFGRDERLLPRQGRVDAHRRLLGRHARRERHRRRRVRRSRRARRSALRLQGSDASSSASSATARSTRAPSSRTRTTPRSTACRSSTCARTTGSRCRCASARRPRWSASRTARRRSASRACTSTAWTCSARRVAVAAAVARARAGDGPTLIVAALLSLRAATTCGDAEELPRRRTRPPTGASATRCRVPAPAVTAGILTDLRTPTRSCADGASAVAAASRPPKRAPLPDPPRPGPTSMADPTPASVRRRRRLAMLTLRGRAQRGAARGDGARSARLLHRRGHRRLGHGGGVYGVTRGLVEEFGPSASATRRSRRRGSSGSSVGAALVGLRPVAEIMYSDFLTLAMDPIVNQAAKIRYMFGGQASVPMVVRTNSGAPGSKAAQHSQSLEAWFMHIPGLKVVDAGDAVRREGAAEVRDPRRRPGDLPRAQAAVLPEGPRAGGGRTWCRSAWPRSGAPGEHVTVVANQLAGRAGARRRRRRWRRRASSSRSSTSATIARSTWRRSARRCAGPAGC